MRNILVSAMAAFTVISLCSCNREPIYDDRSDYRIEISPDYDMLYNRPVQAPSLWRCCFYERGTHRLVSSSTVGSKGGYLYNLEPGVYDALIYDYTFNRNKVSGDRLLPDIHATTNTLAFQQIQVRESPDHLFVQRLDSLVVPHLSERDPEWVLRCSPRSGVDSWLLEVDGIRGLRNAEEIEVYVTGQSGALYFGRYADRLENIDCALYFKAGCDYEREVISTPFNTFGRVDGTQARLVLNLFIQGVGGESYVCRSDVTDQFDDPQNTEHVIRASFDLVIRERRDGGMYPKADPWDPIVEIIDLT